LVQEFHLEEALEHQLRCGEHKHLDLEGQLHLQANRYGIERLRSHAVLDERLCAGDVQEPLRRAPL
jgi:hypothetical protein